MASILNTLGTSCSYPLLPAISSRKYQGTKGKTPRHDSSSPNAVSFARGIPPKARLRLTAMVAAGATQTQTVTRKSTRIPNGPASSKVVMRPKLDQGGGGFPPYRGNGGGGGGGGGGGYGKSSGGFVLFVIIMFLDYLKEVEKKWFKFDDDEYYNQLNY